MKKYSISLLLFIFALVVFYTPANAQKKRKKVNQATSQKKKVKINKRSNTRRYNNTVLKQNSSTNLNDKSEIQIKSKLLKQDTLPEKVVTILSAFKPQLKNLAKIDFVNASERVDTGTIKLDYQVPSQNLSFQYRPIPLVPRSFKVDSLFLQQKNTSIKFGYGNYFHHFIELNHYFIDRNRNTHTFNVNNESITGVHYLQSTRNINLEYLADFNVSDKGHFLSKVYYQQSNRYRYGLVPDTLVLPFANYKQNSFASGASLSWIPVQKYSYGTLQYLSKLSLERFEGIQGATNLNIIFNNPFSIDYSNTTRLNFDFTYNLNQFSPKNSNSQSNQFLRLDPNIQFNKFSSLFKIGVSPILINSELHLYPDISYKKQLKDTNIVVSAGWNAIIANDGYSNVVAQNPWIAVPNKLEMTTQDHKFVALKISNGKRLSYGFSLSLNDYTNLLLLNKLYNKNYTNNGLFYNPIFEKKASTIEFDADMRYQFSDHLLILNNIKYIQFNSIQENIKPWGILPLELNSKIVWSPNHKLQINGNAQYWTGATFTNQASVPYDIQNTFVLNAALNYQLTSHFTAWVKGENLLDKPYERWANYPSLGVQFIAGVVYSFK